MKKFRFLISTSVAAACMAAVAAPAGSMAQAEKVTPSRLPAEIKVGPLRCEVLEGLRRLRFVLEPNDSDIAMDIDPTEWSDAGRMHRELEHRSIEQSVLNLRTFPWIRTRERAGTLELAGGWFDIALGELRMLTRSGWEQVPDA